MRLVLCDNILPELFGRKCALIPFHFNITKLKLCKHRRTRSTRRGRRGWVRNNTFQTLNIRFSLCALRKKLCALRVKIKIEKPLNRMRGRGFLLSHKQTYSLTNLFTNQFPFWFTAT